MARLMLLIFLDDSCDVITMTNVVLISSRCKLCISSLQNGNMQEATEAVSSGLCLSAIS